ncbi:MAG: hypothetical protein IH957_10860 [Chloroflexi bacterium]|nr:hypothetical protein [Chloroflexota bacterium]
MGFLGVGVLELFLIIAIAVVVLGPERIPEFAVQVARAVRFLRNFATDSTKELRSEFEELMSDYDDLRDELRGLKNVMDKATSSVSKDIEGAQRDIRAATTAVDKALAEAKPIIEPGGDIPPAFSGDETADDQKPADLDGDQ